MPPHHGFAEKLRFQGDLLQPLGALGNQPKKQQFGGFQGAHGLGYMDLATMTRAPMVEYLYRHQMTAQIIEKHQFFENFQVPLNSHGNDEKFQIQL